MLIVVFSFFAQCLQPFEIQIHKNLSAKKMKKTYKKICIYRKSVIPLLSNSGRKPERTTNIYSLIKFIYYENNNQHHHRQSEANYQKGLFFLWQPTLHANTGNPDRHGNTMQNCR